MLHEPPEAEGAAARRVARESCIEICDPPQLERRPRALQAASTSLARGYRIEETPSSS